MTVGPAHLFSSMLLKIGMRLELFGFGLLIAITTPMARAQRPPRSAQ